MAHRIILFSFLALMLCITTACSAESPNTPATQTDSQSDKVERLPLTLDDQTFNLELALTPDARFQGLSDRDEIPPDHGMLFVFPKARKLSFVMRRCLVPIDIIFLEPNGRVMVTHAMTVEPYNTPDHKLKRYKSKYPAQFAIELKGGTLKTINIKPGDTLNLPYRDLKRRAK